MGFFTRNVFLPHVASWYNPSEKIGPNFYFYKTIFGIIFQHWLDKMGMYWCAQVCCSPAALSLCCDNEGKVSSKYWKFPSWCVLENYNRKHSTILLELSKELRESRIQHLFHFDSENTKPLSNGIYDHCNHKIIFLKLWRKQCKIFHQAT